MLILCYPSFIGQPIIYITWTANSILETQRHERVFNRGNLMSFVDNPYRNRKPVTDPSQFYGRRNDLLLLAEKIRYGQMCAISGEPLIGKTSLLYYLIHSEGARSLPEFTEGL